MALHQIMLASTRRANEFLFHFEVFQPMCLKYPSIVLHLQKGQFYLSPENLAKN